jgi:hypothetical protein
MHNRWLSIVLLAAVVLAACSPAAPATTPVSSTVGVNPATLQVSTPVAAPPTSAAVAETPTQLPPATCAKADIIPQPNPTVVALIPPVTDKDWTIGPATARISLLEYSDYQ